MQSRKECGSKPRPRPARVPATRFSGGGPVDAVAVETPQSAGSGGAGDAASRDATYVSVVHALHHKLSCRTMKQLWSLDEVESLMDLYRDLLKESVSTLSVTMPTWERFGRQHSLKVWGKAFIRDGQACRMKLEGLLKKFLEARDRDLTATGLASQVIPKFGSDTERDLRALQVAGDGAYQSKFNNLMVRCGKCITPATGLCDADAPGTNL